MLKSRPERRILPNLKELSIYGRSKGNILQYTVIFLHKDLELLWFDSESIAQNSSGELDLLVFFEEVVSRAPKLNRWEGYLSSHNTPTVRDALSQCLSLQMSLTVVTLLHGTLTATVMKSLSALPMLKTISLADKYDDEGKPSLNFNFDLSIIENIHLGPIDGRSGFQSLCHLEIETRLKSVTSLISSCSGFGGLRKLKIDMVCHNDSQDVQTCLGAISKRCTVLKHLELTRNLDIGDRSEVLDLETDVLTKDTLAPLASLKCLRHFSITHTQPIIMSDDELVELLAGYHHLEELHLNPSPIKVVPPMSHLPTLGVLHRIAQCQPKLRQLSLFLDTVSDEELCTTRSVTVLANPFNKLETLELGKSDVSDVDRVALYLSQVLPLGCVIKHNAAISVWPEVIKKLPLFTMFSAGHRRRIRELEEMLESSHSKLKRLSSSNTTLQDGSSDAVDPDRIED